MKETVNMGQEIDIHKVWKVELEIMDIVHKFCEDNNLRYSIAYGTLLGAKRHEGFIPWDDDIDIIMPRVDFNKFIELWKTKAPEGYLIEDYHENNKLTNNFLKIMKSHTTFLQKDYKKNSSSYHGIFIDIFPMDKVPDGLFHKRLQYIASCIELLYFRGYESGHKGMIGLVEKIFLNVKKSNYIKYRSIAGEYKQRWNNITDRKLKYVNAATFEECKMYYSEKLFDQLEKIQFCGRELYATKEWNSFLTTIYGDFMQLPPESERIWHHKPILVDFEHDYEELEKSNILLDIIGE